MLQEERAERIAYDTSKDIARITTGLPLGTGQAVHVEKRETAKVDLLLDKDGFLVGVDLGGGGLSRVVVMLGPHEAVARSESAQIEIARAPSGHVSELTIFGAAAAIKAASKSPYI
jgi:hypothetical protein